MRNFFNVVLIGPMGAGKTSMGKALARELDWEFHDSDQVIEKKAGVNLLWIYDLEGEPGFQKREKQVISELVQKKGIILATGGGTVALPENRKAISSTGLIVYLSATLDDQLVRTGYSKKRPLSPKKEERRIMLEDLHKRYVPIYEELADIVYPTDDKPSKAAVRNLIKLIRKYDISF
jgi:shikimate kinase